MKSLYTTDKNILKYWLWQDIEKPHWLPWLLNIGFSVFLTAIFTVVIWYLPINTILKTLLSFYMGVNIFSYWPVQKYYDNKNLAKGSFYYFGIKFLFFISFFFLIKIRLKSTNE